MTAAQLPDDRWSVDFAADRFIDGRRLRILVVVDNCTRECLALIADTSISGIRAARKLDRLLVERDKPKMIVSDNAPSSPAMPSWAGPSITMSPGITSQQRRQPTTRCTKGLNLRRVSVQFDSKVQPSSGAYALLTPDRLHPQRAFGSHTMNNIEL
jgi:transposase InsO family protein